MSLGKFGFIVIWFYVEGLPKARKNMLMMMAEDPSKDIKDFLTLSFICRKFFLKKEIKKERKITLVTFLQHKINGNYWSGRRNSRFYFRWFIPDQTDKLPINPMDIVLVFNLFDVCLFLVKKYDRNMSHYNLVL